MCNNYKHILLKILTVSFFSIIICEQLCSQNNGPLQFSSNPQVNRTYNSSSASTFNNTTGFVSPIAKNKTAIKTEVDGFSSNGVYTTKDRRIGFVLRLQNTLKEQQAGNINFQLINNAGIVLYKEVVPFLLNKKSSFNKTFEFAGGQFQPGYYLANMHIVSNVYEDVAAYNFGFEPTKIVAKTAIPIDFVSFWENAKRELINTSPNFYQQARPDLSNKHSDVYEVQFNSIDRAVIKGWLSVPKSGSKNGVIYKLGDYLNNQAPELRREMAVFSLNVRGAGGSNTNYNLPYDQYGTFNLQDKNKYILKGIYLDALRGLEYLFSNSGALKIDTRKIVVVGNGLGAAAATAVAVLDPRIKGVVLEGPSFVSFKEMLNFGEAATPTQWPASMYKSFYASRKMGVDRSAMLRTLDYFDPVNFAPFISCPVLVGFNQNSTISPAQCVYNLISQLRVSNKDIHVSKEGLNTLEKGFYGLKETWLKERLRQP
jgi:cephalosporin-C deacetylase